MIDQAAPPERAAPRRHWKALIPPRLGLLVLLVTALALVALAQYNFFKEPANLGDGVLFALLAILTFVLAAAQADHLTAANGGREGALWNALAEAVERAPWRLAFLMSAGTLTLLALNVLRRDPPPPNYNWAVFGWLGAILLYLLAVAPPSGRPRVDWRAWWSSNGWAALIVGGLFVVAFALRVWRLETVPPVLGGDEGSFGLEAVRVIKGEIRNPFSTGWLSNPTLSMY
ncbi:MAG TPA: hypothetical protein VER55_08110, partial [Ardenticatenaceae bacterium]|nr:hypothetical protein [Ardenticatenaceae bacterium]